MKEYKTVLTIAGSDSGGGAGIQADIKTISALGCYAASAITALTAQNTREVTGIFPVSAEFVAKQIEAVLSDIEINAIKIGMLFNAEIISAVAETLEKYKVKNIVLDPVMISKSGNYLLQPDAISALKKYLFPLSTVVTPNLHEASALLNEEIKTSSQMESAAKKISKLGASSVLIKGGHLTDIQAKDVLYHQEKFFWYEEKRIETCNTHGTGCTLSSSIASFLARGQELSQAVQSAKDYLQQALIHGADYKIGKGHGPVQHFWK